jgi:hypothetical protein
MEVSDVRKHLAGAIDRAKKSAAGRRARSDELTREYDDFLPNVAVPLVRQMAGVLKASGLAFSVFTPGGSVRLMSDKTPEDFVEIVLDTTNEEPLVLLRSSRSRNRRVIERERPLTSGPLQDVSEEMLLELVTNELEPLLSR